MSKTPSIPKFTCTIRQNFQIFCVITDFLSTIITLILSSFTEYFFLSYCYKYSIAPVALSLSILAWNRSKSALFCFYSAPVFSRLACSRNLYCCWLFDYVSTSDLI